MVVHYARRGSGSVLLCMGPYASVADILYETWLSHLNKAGMQDLVELASSSNVVHCTRNWLEAGWKLAEDVIWLMNRLFEAD
ncbi:hypothetical protein HaLaN_32315 [Haematococcus lacustris]|uniref:Uncharacterized protein n=1 Tax=Haematococcus lacustris TaxID=44745 RepID=A0A6A0AJN1_HAELA|nr:hypothetical protein HaLaN_32315 [Haematococcus lacustris]